MRRRAFFSLLGGAVAWPIAARAETALPVIGYLSSRSATTEASFVEAFRHGLRENGFFDGQNIRIEFRYAEGQPNRLPALAADLVRRRVNLIVAAGFPAAPAAQKATTTIPIVFSTGSDPIKTGLVASLNRPGGNATGVTTLNKELIAKRVGLLVDLVPKVTTLGYLGTEDEPDIDSEIAVLQEAVSAIGRELLVLHARSDHDIEAAFATITGHGSAALLVGSGGAINVQRGLVVALAARHAIPAAYNVREWAAIGGLMSYGTSFSAMYHQVGVYAGRILKGTHPADLPVFQPTKFELVINLSTAKALGMTIPSGILAIADEVIE